MGLEFERKAFLEMPDKVRISEPSIFFSPSPFATLSGGLVDVALTIPSLSLSLSFRPHMISNL